MARTKEEAAGENGSPDAARNKGAKDSGVKKSATGTGRGRGRPKGSANPKPYTPTGRPRGRPKGSFKKTDGSATTKTSKTPTTPTAAGEKRSRGRPRLAPGATPKSADGSAKKRGRKPKQAASEENDDNDVDAEADEPEVGDDAEHAETESLADGKSSKKASPPEDEVDGDDYDSSEE